MQDIDKAFNFSLSCCLNKRKLYIQKNKNQDYGFFDIMKKFNINLDCFAIFFLKNLIQNDGRYTILEDYSSKKSNSFQLSTQNDTRINNFISSCQYNTINLDEEFPKLLYAIANDNDTNLSTIKHDIDILFQNKQTGVIYYLEVKYNDDHNTGKFVDINRKFIKTYAYLVREFPNAKIEPILFFFNNKKMKGNIYVPENTNIRRGKAFFDEFLSIKYEDVDSYMRNLSESPENIKAFDELYRKIMSIKI
ncbi:HinfI family type II restriction enzyme [Moraxella nasicaprae]|uniref:type II site-specific deoxyribonuclease n=1 Tax=Moraxella nasicaprae TaxID=2904122 RepID=A0ABY6F560_9GAMM|nr:hypothetical protein [Moraxella nasicaprae]UXZ05220.1 hypothetical protein LU297_01845 [Moraxella nasicaprae]